MKQDIHPEYKEVVFHDVSTGAKYLCKSTASTKETTDFEGKTYPCYKVPISSSSHPFFTGDTKFVDTEGRVDKFKKRYSAKPDAQPAVKKDAGDKKEEKKKSPAKKPEAKKAAPKKAEEKKAPAKKAEAKKPAAEKKAEPKKKTEKKTEAKKPAEKKPKKDDSDKKESTDS